MNGERDNEIRRCKRQHCTRATFVETERGISADFHHGGRMHREVYTVEMMKVYLASQGYVVIEAAKVLKVA